jgi:tRNA A58 N-methylase Trm61
MTLLTIPRKKMCRSSTGQGVHHQMGSFKSCINPSSFDYHQKLERAPDTVRLHDGNKLAKIAIEKKE